MFESVVANFVLALVVVVALIGVLSYFGKRFGLIARATRGRADGKRLGIIEVANIDAKRRLLLVRRDEVEHLVLLGAANDLVVEQGIRLGGAPPAAPEKTEKDKADDVPWLDT